MIAGWEGGRARTGTGWVVYDGRDGLGGLAGTGRGGGRILECGCRGDVPSITASMVPMVANRDRQ